MPWILRIVCRAVRAEQPEEHAAAGHVGGPVLQHHGNGGRERDAQLHRGTAKCHIQIGHEMLVLSLQEELMCRGQVVWMGETVGRSGMDAGSGTNRTELGSLASNDFPFNVFMVIVQFG